MNFLSHSISTKKKSRFNFLLYLSFFVSGIFIIACSSSKRFTNDRESNFFAETNYIRVLINEKANDLQINADSQIFISNEKKQLAKVNSGNKILFQSVDDKLKLSISDRSFEADTFFINSGDEDSIIKIDNKKFRGRIKIFTVANQVKVVNQIGLEDYVKGVMTKEMPVGKGNENYEALKAFSICVRTYALLKIFENKSFFDIYPDTRDQVYGGVDAEKTLTNKIVDESRGQILSYNGSPAVIFFHSTCGGYTEDVKNVFGKTDFPYLRSIKDGAEPYCNIAPKFSWTEEYSSDVFLSRLFDAKLISSKNYTLKDVKIKSRFESGRVKELVVTLTDGSQIGKDITLLGNNIRYVIKTFDGKSILRSTLFDVTTDNNKVVIKGKGYGHGVGLCQWGAIGQSQKGINYLSILDHYFPGTKVINYYD